MHAYTIIIRLQLRQLPPQSFGASMSSITEACAHGRVDARSSPTGQRSCSCQAVHRACARCSHRTAHPDSPAQLQVSSLATSLPAHWESSVHVAVDAERFDVLRALILPDSGTPYAFGAFTFDIYFPPGYPTHPPKVPCA